MYADSSNQLYPAILYLKGFFFFLFAEMSFICVIYVVLKKIMQNYIFIWCVQDTSAWYFTRLPDTMM